MDDYDNVPSSSKSALNKIELDKLANEKIKLKLKLRFHNGKDIEITLTGVDNNFLKVKEQVSSHLPEIEDLRLIRLIYQGKIIKEEDNVFELIEKVNQKQNTVEGSSSHLKYGSLNQLIPLIYFSKDQFIGSLKNPIVIQAMVLEHPPTNEEQELQQITPSTGFDRLREAGFSEQDIQQLRQQFQMVNNIDGNSMEPEEIERNRRLEEAWIDNTNQTLPDGIPVGSHYQIIQGMIIGFFGSFLAIIFISDKMFSRYQQLGLAFGFLINIGFGCILAIQ